MLDNFGLGEFFFLAVLALLFFGPERLPQIGARLGQWVANLTQYSKAFMTEWREEALAIHDAVEEVRGIRDEIAAARAEISSSLDVARDDLTDGLDAAREAVTGATSDVTQRLRDQQQMAAQDLKRAAQEERGEVDPNLSGEVVAISKTQQILDGLQEKRGATVADAGERGDGEPVDDTEWDEVHQIIMAGLTPGQQTSDADATGEAMPDEQGVPGAAFAEPEGAAPESAPAEAAEEPPQESAFDQTQAILDSLQRKREGAQEVDAGDAVDMPTGDAVKVQEVADAGVVGALTRDVIGVEEASEPPQESAFDRTKAILDDLAKRRAAKTVPDADTQERREPELSVPLSTADKHEFERLSVQVTRLQGEMEALRAELRALRALATQGKLGAVGADELTVEEVA